MAFLKNFHFDFIGKRFLLSGISIAAMIASIFLIATKGLNFGVDFKGGSLMELRFSKSVSEASVREALDKVSLQDASVQKIGRTEENRIVIKTEEIMTHEATSSLAENLKASLSLESVIVEKNETVGPKAGKDLRRKAQLAIIVSWLLMLIYVGYRFDFAFAPGAIFALVHDVLVALGAFSLSGREVSLTVVAAFLTIIGYSINDTIVIYDRIRENLHKEMKPNLREVVNRSLNEMLSRTIITSLTVFMVVILMYLFGEGEFQNFGFAMTVGVITGVYSTLSMACVPYVWIKEHRSFFARFSGKNS